MSLRLHRPACLPRDIDKSLNYGDLALNQLWRLKVFVAGVVLTSCAHVHPCAQFELFTGLFRYILMKEEYSYIVVGLDNAGKSVRS